MNLYIVDDNINMVKILEKIIEDRDLAEIIGKETNPIKAIEEIRVLKPDIVLIDLLMPEKDGISLVKELKKCHEDIQYIMISQVSDKDMISKAYQSGIEYYISKPIDAIEVQIVIKKVIEKIKMEEKLSKIQSIFINRDETSGNNIASKDKLLGVKKIMQRIGIMGEAGSNDILELVGYLIENNEDMSNYTIRELCSKFADNPRTKEQRIRRTATIGMINLANIGIEDYMNEIFVEFSNGLYNFEQLKLEMDHIRGKSDKRGTVNIRKFLDGLIHCSTLY